MVDYSFYTGTYGGSTVPEAAFSRYLIRARQIFDRLTFSSIVEQDGKYGQTVRGEFREFSSAELLSVKYGLCCLMETLVKLDAAEAKALAGNTDSANIKARTSGGESISYDAVKTAYDVAAGDETRKTGLYRDALLSYMTPTAFRINPFYAGWG